MRISDVIFPRTFWVLILLLTALTPDALRAQNGPSRASQAEQKPAAPAAPGSDSQANDAQPFEKPQPELVPPRLTEFVEAEYPAKAKESGLQATVELEITIKPDGRVSEIRVVTAVGNGFDEAAVEAAKQFVFEPARRDNEPVASRIRYAYVFEIRDIAQKEAPKEEQAPALARIEGKILNSDDDAPIAAVEVLISTKDGSVSHRVLTDDHGVFHLEDLPAGRYTVTLFSKGYNPYSAEEDLASDEITSVVYRLQLSSDPYAFGATARIPPPPREVTRRTISREELTRVAGTRGDPVRTVEILPGVARPPFGSGLLIVRGSSPEDTQALFEGLPISQLYHFGGLTSFVNSRLLESIDFYPGNFSVRYGRKQGGIVEVQAAEPQFDRFHGVADINLVDASLLLSAPIVDDTGVVASIRRSYIDAVFSSIFSSDDFSVTAAPVYWDYQVIGSSRLSSSDKLRVMAYGASDRFKLLFQQPSSSEQEVTGNLDFSNESHRVHATWRRAMSDVVDQDVEIAAGTRDFHIGFGRDFDIKFDLVEIFGRSEWRYRLTRHVRLITGVDILSGPGSYSYVGPPPDSSQTMSSQGPSKSKIIDINGSFTFFDPAVYLESDLDLSPVRVVIGTRLDYFNTIDQFTFDPRLSVRYALTPAITLKAGVGLFSQPPEGQQTAKIIGNPNLKPNRAVHVSTGCEWQPVEILTLGIEGYFKYLFQQVVNTALGEEPRFVNDGIGRIYGLEFLAKVEPKGRFFGYLSYTLSRSERRDRDEGWFLFDFDQPHILTASGTYRLGRGWELGATFRLVSGNPYTPIIDNIYDSTENRHLPIYGERNSARSRLFHRLDVRIEKLWTFTDWKLALYLDVQNSYNASNQEGLIYDYRFRTHQVLTGLPILPVLGLRGEL
jgi:TonB family protein